MNPNNRFATTTGACVFITAAAMPFQQATGFMNIVLNYVGSPLNEPSYDPGGTQLMATMNAAAEYWGRSTGLIQDTHTITIDISWAELSDPNMTLASHTNLDGGPVVRPTVAQIQFDRQFNGVDRLWYFDTTPNVHDEYTLTPSYYGNLTPANQAAWFNGAVPNVLENGFAGTAAPTAPAAAINGTDILSVAIHELGHALGLTTNVATPQTVDGDYDVNPAFVGGAIMGITDDGTFHLPQANTVMAPGINTGIRRLPSAADVFSVASASIWTDVFLRRTDYLGGPILNDPAAWVGGDNPTFLVDANVQSFAGGGFTVAQTSMQFKSLSISDAWVVTALQTGVTLDVAETTTIDGFGTLGGSTRVVLQGNNSPGSLLDTTDLNILNGGRLELEGQIPLAAVRVEQSIEISDFSDLFGHGFVNIINDTGTEVLSNHGRIEADGGHLRLAATNTINPVFDLDGDDPADLGSVRALNGDLSVFGLHIGDFDGELRVGGGHYADFEHTFTISQDGSALLLGTATETATLRGADLILRGDITVDKLARIGQSSSDLATFDGTPDNGGDVFVFVPQTDDILSLEGPAVFRDGLYSGDGTIKQLADITVEANTTIESGTYDWGNSVPTVSHDTHITPDVRFRIMSPTTGTTNNEYRGQIRVENAEFEVFTSAGWTLPPEEEVAGVPRTPAGTLLLENRKSGSNEPVVRGQPITLGGNLIALGGPGTIESQLTTEPTADINVLNQSVLKLDGFTTYNGGNIHGPGKLTQLADASVVGNTTIGTGLMDWDGNDASPSDTTIQPGALLQITSTQIDDAPAADGYDGHVTISDTAALVVFTSQPWRMDGLMTMQGQLIPEPEAIVDGVTMINTGRVEGNGWFQTTVESQGTIAPGLSAGKIRFEQDLTLTIDSVLEHELGGITPIIDFDQIGVGGTATLAGTLDLSLLGGYTPFLDHEFKIIISDSSITGTFDTVMFPTMPGIAFCLRYDTQVVTVTTELIGDLNGDGFVGIGDLNIVLGVWNQNVTAGVWGLGDVTGDGFVGIADLNAILGNWNAGTPPEASAHIPEPVTLWLAALPGLFAMHTLRKNPRVYG